ncbi:serine hydrolase [Arthrobacter sp. DNA4]|uniref:serine hydrolase domain-containing protein n=1 Tax=Arthrobacter sp. DNA4 TaxID=2963432 RepID=UPI0020CF4D68|nr:serine hydrolase [Arthrobacter sp. DNA4]UTT69379.1 serine hydrolase [Arthrobacter sp. DNA4]
MTAAPELPLPRNTSSLLVLQDGRTVVELGDTTRASYVASVRKSLLSVLFGIQVDADTVNLDATLDELGVDDVGGLLPLEKTARLRDLLTSRSGVYHPPSSPGSDEDAFPPRGTKAPGQYFVYNNWDFNAAGAIFEKASGLTVFDAFEKYLAGPLEFDDYDPTRQRMLGDAEKSAFPAYHFFLSTRDLAKIGLLMAAASGRAGSMSPGSGSGTAWPPMSGAQTWRLPPALAPATTATCGGCPGNPARSGRGRSWLRETTASSCWSCRQSAASLCTGASSATASPSPGTPATRPHPRLP